MPPEGADHREWAGEGTTEIEVRWLGDEIRLRKTVMGVNWVQGTFILGGVVASQRGVLAYINSQWD